MACENLDVPQLPDDIFMEILSYLPAKSIGRFRSVSSSWDAQLLSPSFVELHRRRANNPGGQPKLFFSPTEKPSDFYSWQPGGGPVKKLMENELCFPAPVTKPLHGLVLIRSYGVDGGYDVCNPSTGEFMAIQDTRLPFKTILRYSTQTQPGPPSYIHVAYGLGYCSVKDEYKVVRLFSDAYEIAPRCEVLVLRAPAYWRPTVQQPPVCIVEDHNPAVFLNGYLHFLPKDGTILTFNVSDETFGSLPPPPPYLDHENPVVRMTELDGCLCLCREKTDEGPYQAWLLRDFKANKQWEQLCCFDRRVWPEPERVQLQSEWITPLAMCSGRNKVMFGTGTCKVFAVDPDGGAPEIMLSPDEDIPGTYDDTEDDPAIGLLEESLVPLGRIDEEMHLLTPTTEAWWDVLKWLPTRSVMELSLVCREWRMATTNSWFIDAHVVTANSIKRRPRIMFILDPTFGQFCDLDDVPFPPNFRSAPFHCSQPCHGLNVGTYRGTDFLCNPAIRYHQRIEHGDDDQQADPFAGRIALGYDSDDDDHVLVFLAYDEKNPDTRDYKLRCNVRCLKGDSWWRRVEPPPKPVADVPPTYADGKIYWVVDPMLGPRLDATFCELVTFDTMEREFEVVEGPPCGHGGGRVTVVELHDAIRVAWSDREADAIDVWIMEDGGAWSVECRIELAKYSPEYSSERTLLMGIDPTDGRILLNTGQSLGYYNIKTGELETVYRVPARSPKDDSIFCALIYQESLVSPFMN
ncbi:hypothetical protein ACQ4PT_001201 [Festuca glaucescens]